MGGEQVYHQKPWSSEAYEKGRDLAKGLQKLLPYAKVYFIGAVALKLPGTNDIDLNVFCDGYTQEQLEDSASRISKLLGQAPTNFESGLIQWEYSHDGCEIDIILYNESFEGVESQIKLHVLLQNNDSLRHEYADLKNAFDGKPYKDYKEAKLTLFSRILS